MPIPSLAAPALYDTAAVWSLAGPGDVSLTAGHWQGEHGVWLTGRAWEGKAFLLLPQYVGLSFRHTRPCLHPMLPCAGVCPTAALRLGAASSPGKRRVDPSRARAHFPPHRHFPTCSAFNVWKSCHVNAEPSLFSVRRHAGMVTWQSHSPARPDTGYRACSTRHPLLSCESCWLAGLAGLSLETVHDMLAQRGNPISHSVPPLKTALHHLAVAADPQGLVLTPGSVCPALCESSSHLSLPVLTPCASLSHLSLPVLPKRVFPPQLPQPSSLLMLRCLLLSQSPTAASESCQHCFSPGRH